LYSVDTTDLPNHTRRLTVGGKLVLLDIDFTVPPDPATVAQIAKISLSIAPADDESISSFRPAAAEVLTTNYIEQDGSSFVQNLRNLANWDTCSEPPNEGLNCFITIKGLETALEVIHLQELKVASEYQVLSKGWGKPTSNYRNLIGVSIIYFRSTLSEYLGHISVESRRRHYVHPPLQAHYLSPSSPFILEDLEMFPLSSLNSEFLTETPNWLENAQMSLLPGPNASFVLHLTPGVLMSVEGAQKVCEVVGLGGWSDVLSIMAKEEWIIEGNTFERRLVCGMLGCADEVWWGS
jgi:Mediator of RNA polymerase II transcription subunit 1